MMHARRMAPTHYSDVLAGNIRSARTRIDREQESAAARMRALGYAYWTRQTVSKVERGDRRVLAEEIPGLAYALQTTISALMAPRDEDKTVEFQPGGEPVSVESLQLSARGQVDDSVWWNEDEPLFPCRSTAPDHLKAVLDVTSRMRAGTWPPEG